MALMREKIKVGFLEPSLPFVQICPKRRVYWQKSRRKGEGRRGNEISQLLFWRKLFWAGIVPLHSTIWRHNFKQMWRILLKLGWALHLNTKLGWTIYHTEISKTMVWIGYLLCLQKTLNWPYYVIKRSRVIR